MKTVLKHLRSLNLYSFKCILITSLIFNYFLLGAPLPLGALSARVVRLWVNPALTKCRRSSPSV